MMDAFLVSANASPFPLTNSPGFAYSFFSRKQEKKRSPGSMERLNKYDAGSKLHGFIFIDVQRCERKAPSSVQTGFIYLLFAALGQHSQRSLWQHRNYPRSVCNKAKTKGDNNGCVKLLEFLG